MVAMTIVEEEMKAKIIEVVSSGVDCGGCYTVFIPFCRCRNDKYDAVVRVDSKA